MSGTRRGNGLASIDTSPARLPAGATPLSPLSPISPMSPRQVRAAISFLSVGDRLRALASDFGDDGSGSDTDTSSRRDAGPKHSAPRALSSLAGKQGSPLHRDPAPFAADPPGSDGLASCDDGFGEATSDWRRNASAGVHRRTSELLGYRPRGCSLGGSPNMSFVAAVEAEEISLAMEYDQLAADSDCKWRVEPPPFFGDMRSSSEAGFVESRRGRGRFGAANFSDDD